MKMFTTYVCIEYLYFFSHPLSIAIRLPYVRGIQACRESHLFAPTLIDLIESDTHYDVYTYVEGSTPPGAVVK